MKKKLTVKDLFALKGKKKLVFLRKLLNNYFSHAPKRKN